jgi:hypothetical protein
MAYVTSSSTLDQIRAAIQDSSSYDVANSATLAREFIVACRALLAKMAQSVHTGEHGVTESPEQIQAMLSRAEAWWAANDSTANSSKDFVTFGSFEYLR